MTVEDLIKYIKQEENLTKSTLTDIKSLCDSYPYFQSAIILYLKNLYNNKDIQYNNNISKTALYANDRDALHKYITTAFINKSINKNENISVAFAYDLEADSTENINNETQHLEHEDLINKFITDNPKISAIGSDKSNNNTQDISTENDVSSGIFTESLAKIYIKQKHYDKALRIFEKLNLKYPEKSAYFANQIQNLEKIIKLNQ